MSDYINIADDYMMVMNDFLGTATLKIDGISDIALPRCVLNEPRTIKELDPTGGKVLRHGTMFVWPKKYSPKPTIGSRIVDEDGTYWTIWSYLAKDHVETHEAFCLKLGIVPTELNKALLLKAVYVHGEAGEAVARWHGYFSGQDPPEAQDTILSHFQPLEETARIEFGAEWNQQAYRVYLQNPIPMQFAGGEYRLVDVGGQRYRAIRYYDENRLDRLPIIHAVKIVEGEEYFQGGGGPNIVQSMRIS